MTTCYSRAAHGQSGHSAVSSGSFCSTGSGARKQIDQGISSKFYIVLSTMQLVWPHGVCLERSSNKHWQERRHCDKADRGSIGHGCGHLATLETPCQARLPVCKTSTGRQERKSLRSAVVASLMRSSLDSSAACSRSGLPRARDPGPSQLGLRSSSASWDGVPSHRKLRMDACVTGPLAAGLSYPEAPPWPQAAGVTSVYKG